MVEHDRVVEAIASRGGTASTHVVRELTSRRAVERAVTAGVVLRLRRGVLCLPVLDATTAAVLTLGGARSHLSAALHHGWAVVSPPPLPEITIPRGRHVVERGRTSARIHWAALSARELETQVTAPERTVCDCARTLAFGEALAVADAALRSGKVSRASLATAARRMPRTGTSKSLAVTTAADDRAATVFESLLRGIASSVPGLALVPQVHVGGDDFIGAADHVDVRLRIVVEAESWAYHGGRSAFARDVRRYTAMAASGWLVLRFVWDDVRHRPDQVLRVLTEAVALAERRAQAR